MEMKTEIHEIYCDKNKTYITSKKQVYSRIAENCNLGQASHGRNP